MPPTLAWRRAMCDTGDGQETGRASAAPRGPAQREIVQLDARPGVAQQQAAAAHVAPAHELRGKAQALAERLQQGLDVFRGGDAAQQHHLAVGPDRLGEALRMAKERATKAGVIGADVDTREAPQTAHVDRGLRELEPVRGSDDVDAGHTGGRIREGARVGELAAEVEAAQKGEDLAQGRARGGAQAEGEVEAGAGESKKTRLTSDPPPPISCLREPRPAAASDGSSSTSPRDPS